MMRALAIFAGIAAAEAVNQRPVIAAVLQPSTDAIQRFGDAYLVGSYVAWVESAGARVAPLPYWDSTLRNEILAHASGVIFPGGAADIVSGPFADSSRAVLAATARRAAAGDPVPVWGTCLGFEQIVSFLHAESGPALSEVDAERLYLPLDLVHGAPAASRLLRALTPAALTTLTGRNVTINLHTMGLLESTYAGSPSLQASLRLLSTNADRQVRHGRRPTRVLAPT